MVYLTMLSVGTAGFIDVVHHLISRKHNVSETESISESFFFLEYEMKVKVWKPSDPKHYIPTSKSFRI
jgi:hypothetical protein